MSAPHPIASRQGEGNIDCRAVSGQKLLGNRTRRDYGKRPRPRPAGVDLIAGAGTGPDDLFSSLFLYVDNEVIIAIHAGGKTRHSHAGDCTVSFRTLIFSRAADNGHRSLRSAYCLLDFRCSVQLVPKNRAVIEREVVVCRKRAGTFYVIGYEDKIGGSDRPVGKRG
jgi:hypothetical protein